MLTFYLGIRNSIPSTLTRILLEKSVESFFLILNFFLVFFFTFLFILQVNETNFAPGGSADVGHGKACIQIDGGRQDYTGAWENANCSVSQGFICEKTACK